MGTNKVIFNRKSRTTSPSFWILEQQRPRSPLLPLRLFSVSIAITRVYGFIHIGFHGVLRSVFSSDSSFFGSLAFLPIRNVPFLRRAALVSRNMSKRTEVCEGDPFYI